MSVPSNPDTAPDHGAAGDPHAQARRDQILAAAIKAFADRGYARTTMDQVAHEAKLAKGSLYNYFPSKQELFMALFTRSIAGAEQQTEALIAADLPAQEKIHRCVDVWFQGYESFCSIGGLVLEFWTGAAREPGGGEMTAALRQVYQVNRGRIAAIVSQGMSAGEFSPGDAVNSATTIMALLDGLMLQAILNVGVEVNAEFLAALKQRLVAALKAGGGAGNMPPRPPEPTDDCDRCEA